MAKIILWLYMLWLSVGFIDTIMAMNGVQGAGMLGLIAVGTMIPLGVMAILLYIVISFQEDERDRRRRERAEREYINDSAKW